MIPSRQYRFEPPIRNKWPYRSASAIEALGEFPLYVAHADRKIAFGSRPASENESPSIGMLGRHFHFTPTYSSWLNQVEVWFAKIERDVIARGIFTSVKDLSCKLMRYIRHYNQTATPLR